MIKVGIVGYGNLAKGLEKAIANAPDMKLVAVFTRRNPESVSIHTHNVKVHSLNNVLEFKDSIDVMALCGGSATDLPHQGPEILANFNTVDSFDTHAKIPEYLNRMHNIGRAYGKLGIISVGWDPGLFSLMRVYFESFLPSGNTATFWGKGVSQGHSDALRRIKGVLNAVQYTIPKEDALDKARNGCFDMSAREKHLRECFVVADKDADKTVIEREIVSMPDYFADYDTVVHFITMPEFQKKHTSMPHGGFVLRSGLTGKEHKHLMELSLKLDSNPEFTSSVMLAFLRANYRLNKEGHTGAITVYDVAPKYLLPIDYDLIVKTML